jgi:hypothetical protein
MTPIQMQLSFTQGLSDMLHYDFDISTLEIERFLNLAQESFVDRWYQIFEVNEAARKRLSSLVTTLNINKSTTPTVVPTVSTVHSNSTIWTLPTDCKYVLKEEATIQLTESTTKRIPVIPINLDYYNQHIKNSYKKPYNDLFWRMDMGSKKHEIIGNGLVINTYHVTYLKVPLNIKILGTAVPSEISSEYHNEVVNEAINIALQTLSIKSSNTKE